ncbi:GntR family transcriptional regulator [Spirillospora sp. NPDC047279]|uniref:GntR family transcriptional regulator n=1 Tax=Spirillospora sp. NPDC047279 TaxID=3155478 RepID=UPI0033D410A6
MTQPWLSNIAAERGVLDRSSTAARVADLLREQIITGLLVPGTRLPEEELGKVAKVSRNTLREAFRLLVQERLLVHEFNRGVFVRTLTAGDVADIYRARRMLECEGLRSAATASPAALARLDAAVTMGEEAAAADLWPRVGTADLRFHQAVTGLAGSPRLDEMVYRLLAELRLAFHTMSSPRDFHAPYLKRNRTIVEMVRGGDSGAAERELLDYLDTAETQLIRAYEAQTPDA